MAQEETYTHKLRVPITINGETYKELTFREAEVDDFVAAEKFSGDMNYTKALLAGMAEVPVPVLGKMKMREMKSLMVKVAPLMGNEEGLPAEMMEMLGAEKTIQ